MIVLNGGVHIAFQVVRVAQRSARARLQSGVQRHWGADAMLESSRCCAWVAAHVPGCRQQRGPQAGHFRHRHQRQHPCQPWPAERGAPVASPQPSAPATHLPRAQSQRLLVAVDRCVPLAQLAQRVAQAHQRRLPACGLAGGGGFQLRAPARPASPLRCSQASRCACTQGSPALTAPLCPAPAAVGRTGRGSPPGHERQRAPQPAPRLLVLAVAVGQHPQLVSHQRV